MRSQPFRSRSISLVVVFAFSFFVASASWTRAAHAAPAASETAAPPPIELREVVWGDRVGGMRHAQVPFQNGKILDGTDLYSALDRPDLVDSYHRRVAAKATLVGLGLLGIAVGGVMTATTIPGQDCAPTASSTPFAAPTITCRATGGGPAHDVGIGIMLASPLVFLAGMLISPDPVETTERDGLIEEFNAARTQPHAGVDHVGPTLSPGGAGLAVSGRF